MSRYPIASSLDPCTGSLMDLTHQKVSVISGVGVNPGEESEALRIVLTEADFAVDPQAGIHRWLYQLKYSWFIITFL